MQRADRFITLGVIRYLQWLKSGKNFRIPILMYHGLSDDPETGIHPYYRLNTSPVAFANQMELLAEQGYRVVGLDEAVEKFICQRKCIHSNQSHKPVVITFDDGFSDFYDRAFPVLAGHGYSATVFLPTAFIGGKIEHKSFLSWRQVRELDGAGIAFGSHTMTHPHLDGLTRIEIQQEMLQSKEIIESNIGKRVGSFSFPFGFPEHDKEQAGFLRNVLQTCGYSCAVTTGIGTVRFGDDIWSLKRIPVNSADDPALLLAKLEGGYDWLYLVQSAFKSVRAMLGIRRKRDLIDWGSGQ